MNFPKISGANLLRKQVELPRDLEGEYNILFIPFKQRQQTDVDSWAPFAARLEADFPTVCYYELPTIQEMGFLRRTFINEGMRAGIPNPKTRQRTITLYINKSLFRRILGIGSEDEITVMLIRRTDGEVLWRTIGRYTDAAATELRQAASELSGALHL